MYSMYLNVQHNVKTCHSNLHVMFLSEKMNNLFHYRRIYRQIYITYSSIPINQLPQKCDEKNLNLKKCRRSATILIKNSVGFSCLEQYF